MRKAFLLIVIIFATQNIFAQDSVSHKGLYIKKVTAGVMFSVIATAPMPFSEKPFTSAGFGFAPSINIITNKTHHHVMYECFSNSIQTLNGRDLGSDWDAYVFYSQSLNSLSKQYGSIGIEKVFPISGNLLCVLFTEVGTNFKGSSSISLGSVLNINGKIR